jgi:hypothetical protein
LDLYGSYTNKINRKDHSNIEHGPTTYPPSKYGCSGNA